MGRYINKLHDGTRMPPKGKAEALIRAGAIEISKPTEFIPGKLVCVIDNGFFEAAGYAYSENEMMCFADEDRRLTRWFTYEHAEDVAA